MDDKLSQTATQLPYLEMGSGFLMGLAVGYVVKKSFKLLLLVLGLVLIAIFVLENKQIVAVNEESLNQTISMGAEAFKGFVAFLQDRLSALKVAGGVSAAAGFIAGLKMG